MSDLPLARKVLGQHWLDDTATLQYICDAGEVNAEDTVLEIGPGTGTLTTLLVERAKKVIAVEFDPVLATELPSRVPAGNLHIVHQDILRFDLTCLPPDYKVIANIPYYLTSNLIRVLSESPNQAISVVLLIQKEVAERIAASPGHMSLLSVSAQFFWHIGLGEVVPAKLFIPPPKVDSQVITLDRRNQPLFAAVDEKLFFRVVKAGFASRRKTLLNSLAGGLRTDKAQLQEILGQAQIAANLRPQALALEDWYSLYKACVAKNLF
jgi:16S rRNA (adenine1518-N6/adenine1519-N6)-dimethyltransferase